MDFDRMTLLNRIKDLSSEVERLKTDLRLVNAELSGFKLAVEHREQELRDLSDKVEKLKAELGLVGLQKDANATRAYELRKVLEALRDSKFRLPSGLRRMVDEVLKGDK